MRMGDNPGVSPVVCSPRGGGSNIPSHFMLWKWD